MIDRRLLLLGLAGSLAACGTGAASRPRPQDRVGGGDFRDIGFAAWTDDEPEYLLYPGDEVEVATPTAPELTRSLRVGPDGRIALPLVGQLMVADRTIAEVEAAASAAYASQLIRPVVEITLKQAGPLKVWVDGEVRNPGVFDMNGDIDAWQAIIQAGGFLPTAKRQEIALVRRGPGGSRMLRVIDLRQPRGQVVALRRGDILFAPRSTLGELANFFTQVRAALPIGFSYAIGGAYTSF